MNQIKWIIFDFDEVISRTNGWYLILITELRKKYYSLNHEKAVNFMIENAHNWFISKWDEKMFLDKFNSRLKLKITMKVFDKALDKTILPEKRIVNLMKNLKKRHKLALLTDNPYLKIKKISTHKDLERLFDHPAGSGHYKARKKDGTLIFKKLIKDLKVSPEETIFIDDNQRNCNFAESIGMNSICFSLGKDSVKNLIKELKNLGASI